MPRVRTPRRNLFVTRLDDRTAPALFTADAAFAGLGTNSGGQHLLSGLKSADFNNDGIDDIVAVNRQTETFQVFLNDGSGTFSPGVALSDPDRNNQHTYESDVLAVDVNADGNADILGLFLDNVVGGFSGEGVAVWLGAGDGSFVRAPIGTGLDGALNAECWAGATADFNIDGKLDFVVTQVNGSSSGVPGGVQVFLGAGDGTFAAVNDPLYPQFHAGVSTLAAADFDGDGNPDFAAEGSPFGSASNGAGGQVAFGDGTGKIAEIVTLPPADGVADLNTTSNSAVADFTGDGKPDFLLAQYNGDLYLYANTGNRTFAAPAKVASDGIYAYDMAVADFDGNGTPDVLTASRFQGTTVLLNDGTGTFTPADGSPFPGASDSFRVAVGNFSGDGSSPDAVVGSYDQDVLQLFRNTTVTTRTAAAAPAAVVYSLTDTGVNLSATVTTANDTVNATAGAVVFTLKQGTVTIGTPVTAAVNNGTATAAYLLPGGTPAGAYTLFAEYGGAAGFPASADSTRVLTVAPAATTTDAASVSKAFSPIDQTVTLSATVGSPAGTVSAGAVTFVVRDSFGSAIGSGTTVTVSNGAAAVDYVIPAYTRPGVYTISAAYGGTANLLPSADAANAVTITSGPLAEFAVSSGQGQTTVVGTAFADPITVRADDAFGNPVSGVVITVSGPAGAGATYTTPAPTNALGLTTFTATANGVAGAYLVTVRSGAIFQTFQLTNTPGALASLTAGGGGQTATVAATFATPVTFVARDSFGNPVPDAVITFTVPAAGASATGVPPSLTADAAGFVSLTPAANTVAGSYTIGAGSGPITGSAGLTNTAGAVAGMVVRAGGGGQTTAVGTAFATAVQLLLTDTFGNPVPGITVTVSGPATGAGIAAVTPGPTNALGLATFTATANAVAGGPYTVTVAAAGVSRLFTLTNVAGPVASLAIVGGDNQTATVGTAFGAAVGVAARDAFGNPVAGVVVGFSVPASGPAATGVPATLTTDATGFAAFTPSANTAAGGFTLTAAAGPVSAGFRLTNAAGPLATITVTGGGQTTAVGTTFATPVQFRSADAFGNPVPGITVTVSGPATGAGIAAVTPAPTDALGNTQFVPTANTVAGGPYTVTVSAAGVGRTFTLTNAAGPVASLAIAGGDNQTATAGTAFGPLTVVARDAFGNPVPNVVLAVAAPPAGPSAVVPATATTDAAGVAGVSAAANGVAGGPYAVTVSGGTASATFTLANAAGPATTITVTGGGQTAAVGSAFGTPIGVVVTDATGNPIAGVSFTVTGPTTGAGATFSTPGVTDADGKAIFTATAGTTAGGPYAVTVAAVGGVSRTFTLTNATGAAATLTLTGGGQTAAVGTAFNSNIQVVVADAFGNPIPGLGVTVVRPATGAGATFSAPAPTDGLGATRFTAAANTTAGAYLVTVSAGGVSTTITLTNAAGPVAAVVVKGGSGQAATVNTPFGGAVTLSVTDAFGNPVPGAVVTLSAPGAGPSAVVPTTVTTDARGVITFTPTANTVAGDFAVTAAVGSATAAVELTNAAGPATTLAVRTGGGQTTTVGTPFASPIGVTLTDDFGNPLAGVPVIVTAPGTGPAASFPAPGVTDARGQVVFTATADTRAGAFVGTVTAGGLTVTFPLANAAGPPATITVAGGAGQTAAVGGAFAGPILFEITDAFGNPAGPLGLTITAPTAGASAAFGPATATGTPGRVWVTATANGTPGRFPVTATAGTASTSFTLTTTTGVPTGPVRFAVGSDVGPVATAMLYDRANAAVFTVRPFGESFTGGARVAAADVTGDGVPDLIAGTGPGAATAVVVYDGVTGAEVFRVSPFEASFTGGVYVAVGDITGDGVADLAVTPDEGGGPRVDLYRGNGFGKFGSFFGIDDAAFRGGARAAVGDVNGDSVGDLTVVAGFGGGPRVAAFDGKSVRAGSPTRVFGDFFAFEQTLRNGVFVTVGDLDGDGNADVICGGGPGGGPRVLAFSGRGLAGGDVQTPLANFFGGNPDARGGIRLAVKDLDGDDRADVVVGAGAGAGGRVTSYLGKTIPPDGTPAEYSAFVAGFSGGVFVG